MILGDKSIFAIEFEITKGNSNDSLFALGFFVIYIKSYSYGVRTPDATMLGCSYNELRNRLLMRGKHIAPFSKENAGEIANAVRYAIYAPEQENNKYFDIGKSDFCNIINNNRIIWAPDGDQAFDDGSYVLHFDMDDKIRLIAFRSIHNDYQYDPDTLVDAEINTDDFYQTLESCYDSLLTYRNEFSDDRKAKRP